ncbi:MAG: efflux RND transporter periplasmic adaptor subunit [Gemmatimonadaceae bacterium]
MGDSGWIRSEGRIVTQTGARVVVSAEAFGRVKAMAVLAGDRVEQGAVLVVLTSRDAQAAMEAAYADLREAQADVTFATAEEQRTQRLSQADHAPAEAMDRAVHALAVAVARRGAARAAVERAQAALDRRSVRAPLSGTVLQRDVDPGVTVTPGEPIATIADLSRREIEAQVDEFDLPSLHVGADVRITAEGFGSRTWIGHVRRIPANVVPRTLRPEDPGRPEDTGVLLVKITIPPGVPLVLGQRVELWISANSRASQ